MSFLLILILIYPFYLDLKNDLTKIENLIIGKWDATKVGLPTYNSNLGKINNKILKYIIINNKDDTLLEKFKNLSELINGLFYLILFKLIYIINQLFNLIPLERNDIDIIKIREQYNNKLIIGTLPPFEGNLVHKQLFGFFFFSFSTIDENNKLVNKIKINIKQIYQIDQNSSKYIEQIFSSKKKLLEFLKTIIILDDMFDFYKILNEEQIQIIGINYKKKMVEKGDTEYFFIKKNEYFFIKKNLEENILYIPKILSKFQNKYYTFKYFKKLNNDEITIFNDGGYDNNSMNTYKYKYIKKMIFDKTNTYYKVYSVNYSLILKLKQSKDKTIKKIKKIKAKNIFPNSTKNMSNYLPLPIHNQTKITTLINKHKEKSSPYTLPVRRTESLSLRPRERARAERQLSPSTPTQDTPLPSAPPSEGEII